MGASVMIDLPLHLSYPDGHGWSSDYNPLAKHAGWDVQISA